MGHVSSEIGGLRTVLVHRSGIEMSHITPENNDRTNRRLGKAELCRGRGGCRCMIRQDRL